jgi:hypothetical protein
MGSVHNISINNVTAYGAGEWGSSITGQPGFPVENISLSNIQLFIKGGVKSGDYSETVKEDAKGYPQPTTWRTLPASGLYIRHVKGISIHNVTFGVDNADERVPVLADDVSDLQISGTRLSGPYRTGTFVRGINLSTFEVEKPVGWKGGKWVEVRGNGAL